MRKFYFYVLFSLFCLANNAFSQTKNNLIDSLEIVLKKNQEQKVLAHKKDYLKIDTTRVNTLNLLSIELIFSADLKRAEQFANEALEIANKVDFKRGQANAYNNLGEFFRKQSDYPLAMQNLEKSLKISNVIDYKEAIANTYHNMANVYNNTSNYPEALKYNFASLKIREGIKDRFGIARSYNNLGIVSTKIRNYKDALKYYTIALEIRKELNDKRELSTSYNNLGILHENSGNYKQALINYFEVVEISKELNNKHGLASVYFNIGIVYNSIGDFDKSIEYNLMALDLQKSMSNKFGVARCYINAAVTNKALRKFQFSKEYLDSAIKLSKEIGAKQLIRDSYKLLSEVDSLEFDWNNAFNHYIIYTQYKDSIINKDNLEKMKQSQIQYELEKKDLEYQKLIALNEIQFEYKQKQSAANSEKERQRLKYEQKIKEQKLNYEYSKKITKVKDEQKQQVALNEMLASENKLMIQNSKNEFIIRCLMILASVAFVGFGINYYKNYNRQKAANIIIAKQGEDLRALLQELNHRVKNNFQTVASMLKMQSRSLEDKTTVAILNQTSNRFLSISSVHEKFYQLESFSGLPIKDFLYDIVANISYQFDVANDKFEFKITDHSSLQTNIQTVLPLVLIVNELVTNSFKHAYNAHNLLLMHIVILQIKKNKYQLVYSDNGPGLPLNFASSNKFGLKLLNLFAEQLKGNIQFSNENGVVVTLVFEYE